MIKLWGRMSSVNVQKVTWSLLELNLDYQQVVVGGIYGGTDSIEYLKLNPTGKVPTIQDNELNIWESHTILRYLWSKYGEIATGSQEWYVGDQWMDFTNVNVMPHFIQLFWQEVRLPRVQRNPTKASFHKAELEKAFLFVEQRLQNNQWLNGKSFGPADIALGSLMERTADLTDILIKFEHLHSWVNNLRSRRPYVQTIMTDYDELRG